MARTTQIGLCAGGIVLATAGPAAAAPARATEDVVVMARQGEGGAPSLVLASGGAPAGMSAEQAARHHLGRLRGIHGAPHAAVQAARVVHVHDTGRGGIIVVLRPTVAGVDVLQGDVKVLIDRRHRLRAVSGSLHPAAHPGSARAFTIAAPAAVAAAVRELYGVDVPKDRIVPAREPARAGSTYFELAGAAPGLRFDRPARVRPVYFPVGAGLVPAHRIELQATREGRGRADAFVVVIAADDGRVLARRDAVYSESFTYRVWADPDGDHRPLDGPLVDVTPHPAGAPVEGPMGGVAPVLVTMEGFNTNPEGVADPWLPAGATETVGNNVDAYVNHSGGEGFGGADYRAQVTAPGVFDRVYDLAEEPLAGQEQGMASITQLFYTTNWLHDWWYDSGFVESAGNAQTDNFGRGGIDGDPLRALAQEAAFTGARDNAYIAVLEDGESPHMHMFLWSELSTELSLTVQPMDQVFAVGQAKFGPKIYDVSGELVVVDDGMGTSPSDGCEPPLNDLTDKIVLIDRGTCEFELKASLAEAAGAVGVIFPDILADQPAYPPGPDHDMPDPAIPAQGLPKADGDALKAQLQNGPLTARMVGNSPPERDGTLDDMVVAHEWGHYFHLRVVECLSQQCGAQSEGWGDFLALHMALRPGDDLHGTYGDTNYAGLDPTRYFGLRRVPYSVDFARNALTLRHITDGEPLPDEHPTNDLFGAPNSEVHNAGEVWATMLWEVYVALHEASAGRKSFDEVRRAMSDYVVAGMILAPPAPTYLEQRDALLAAMAEQDAVDFAAAAAAFARRGAGTCAVGPTRDSLTFDGVMEDFEVRAVGTITAAGADDSPMSCDRDGAVDVGEAGLLTVEIGNRGGADLAGAKLAVEADSASVVFAGPTAVDLGELAPLATTALSFPFTVPDALPGVEFATIRVTLTTPDGCTSETIREVPVVLNGDPMDAASSVDDVEAGATLWKAGGAGGEVVWSRQANVASGQGWHAEDVDVTSDTWLLSPVFAVAADQPLKIAFEHAHYFDTLITAEDSMLAWDGGVVEITKDGGKTWEDVAKYADPGYEGTIASSDNPLSNRPGYVYVNPSYPGFDAVELDLGMAFAGQQIQLRFRVGTDLSAGAPGWDIDNIGFFGVTTTPFPGWVSDPGGACVGPEPTTGADEDGSADTGAPEPTTGDTTDAATTGSQQGADDGCGCRSAGAPGGWQLAPWLALAGLGRRRRRS